MTRRVKIGLGAFVLFQTFVSLFIFFVLRPKPAPAPENYCLIAGTDSLHEIGYEVHHTPTELGNGQWTYIGSKSGSNGTVRIDLYAPSEPKAVRISAKLPSGRYLAENYAQPIAYATVICHIGGSDVTLTPHPILGYTRGVEMAGTIAGTIPRPIRTN